MPEITNTTSSVNHGICPNCGADLNGADIYEFFFAKYNSKEKALETAAMFGWTKERPLRFARYFAVYSQDRDRTIAYACMDCGHEWSVLNRKQQ